MKYVYLVRAGEGEYKVGVASNILNRVRALQTSNANRIEVIVAKQTPDASAVEKSIHQSLVKLNAGGGKEWFRMTPQQALDVAVMISNSPSLSKTDVEILQDLLEENLLKQQRIMGRFNSFIEQFNHENKQAKVNDLAAGNAKKIDLKLKRDAAIKAKADESERLYQEAIKVCAELQKASTSLLQRRLSIGYGRAARIMERLELEGYVTGPDGSHARTFLGQPVKEDIINTFS